MGWSFGDFDDWNQRHHVPFVISASVVSCRSMGPAICSPQWCDCHGLVTIRHLLFPLPRYSLYADACRRLCDDLQRGFWIQLGSYPMVIPSRDLAPQHPIQGCKLIYCHKLGLQLACWGDDTSSTGVDHVETLSHACILLCYKFYSW